MITYFANHEDIGSCFVQQGAVIPIHNINMYDYTIFCEIEGNRDFLEEWNIVKEIGVFNLSIGDDNCFWVTQLNELQEWDNNKLQGTDYLTEEVYYGIAKELKTAYRAVRIDLTKGYYTVRIFGLKRKNPFSGKLAESLNYGFCLELKPVSVLEKTADPTETNFKFYWCERNKIKISNNIRT